MYIFCISNLVQLEWYMTLYILGLMLDKCGRKMLDILTNGLQMLSKNTFEQIPIIVLLEMNKLPIQIF